MKKLIIGLLLFCGCATVDKKSDCKLALKSIVENPIPYALIVDNCMSTDGGSIGTMDECFESYGWKLVVYCQ